MKKHIRLLVLLLCLFLVFGAVAEAVDDPVVVRVGQVEYPLSLARYSYQSNLDIMAYQDYTPSAEEKQQLRQQTVDHLVDLALIENKLIERGKNTLTDAEESLLAPMPAIFTKVSGRASSSG